MERLIHVRFSPELKDFFCGWIPQKSSRYIVSEESGAQKEGLHYHAMMYLKVKEDAVRKAVNTELARLNLKGERGKENKYYGALKEWNVDDICYVAKMGNITMSSGFTEDELYDLTVEGKQRYSHKLPGYQSPPKHERKAKAKESVDDLVDRCVAHIKSLKLENNYYTAVSEATRFIMKDRKGRIDDFRLFPIVRSVIWNLEGKLRDAIETKAIDTVLQKLGPRIVMSGSQVADYSDLISHS